MGLWTEKKAAEIHLRHQIRASSLTARAQFFPMAYSFICPGEIVAFNARVHEFSSKSTAVIFASTDSEHVLKAWNATPIEEGGLGGVSVPLLSDRQRRLAKEYGVLIEEEGIAQRGVFVIDPTGIIRWLSISDANVGRSVDEVVRVLDALKFTGKSCFSPAMIRHIRGPSEHPPTHLSSPMY